jgi:hypothetical protein
VARLVLILLAILTLASTPGCVRISFDLCDEADAHPECPNDAGASDAAASSD